MKVIYGEFKSILSCKSEGRAYIIFHIYIYYDFYTKWILLLFNEFR